MIEREAQLVYALLNKVNIPKRINVKDELNG